MRKAVCLLLLDYDNIIARFAVNVNSKIKIYRNFFISSGSGSAGATVHSWGIAAGVAGGGESVSPLEKIKRTILRKNY